MTTAPAIRAFHPSGHGLPPERDSRPVPLARRVDVAAVASWQASQEVSWARYHADSPSGRELVARAVVR